MGSKTAFVSIVGRANSGKSSLLNAMIGEKIAAVSCKPQTTRTKITGVLTKGDTQLIFIDTPGMHKAKNKLSQHMVESISESVSNVDIAVLMTDCTKTVSDHELALIENFKATKRKAILAVNKIDLIDKNKLLKVLDEYSKLYNFEDVIPMSVINGEGLDILYSALQANCADEPHYFPDDTITDQPEKVIMAEMIREKALLNLNDEIPHGIAVSIEELKERTSKSGEDILDISAVIYCERESHKRIIIGKKGSMLQKIGHDARLELEDFFKIKVNLQCWVKVKEGWRNREGLIRNFGLSNK